MGKGVGDGLEGARRLAHTLLCVKQTIKENLLYSTGELYLVLCVIYMEGNQKRGYMLLEKKKKI